MRTAFVVAGLVTALASACATGPDTRPETANYVVEAILVPYCGRAGCHSSGTRAKNFAFDTVPNALAAFADQRGQPLVVPGAPQSSRLFTVLTDSRKIMPPDVPLPQADIDLIGRWIMDGASGVP